MDEETSKIRKHIDTERQELGRNFDEIGNRVKHATDLKAHFNENTVMILGAAVAGGFLLSLAFRTSSNSDSQSGQSAAHPKGIASKHLQRFSDTLDAVFDGLVGVAAGKLESFIADAVPGFQAQYDAVDPQRNRSSVHDFSAAK